MRFGAQMVAARGQPRALARLNGSVINGLNLKNLFSDGSAGGWWDVSDPSTLFSDTAMTTPATLGGAVAAVRDKSGNGNTLLQATLAKRPILSQTADGRLYLAFDGVSHFMGASFTAAQPLSRALHIRLPSISASTQMICDGYYAAGSGTVNTQAQLQRTNLTSPATNTSHAFLLSAGSSVNTDLGHIPIGAAETAFLDFNGATSYAGDDDWPVVVRNPGTASPNGIIIAGRAGYSGGADQLAKLDFFGAVHIGRLLTTTEKRQIQAFNDARRPADIVETIVTCGDSIFNMPTFAQAIPEKLRQLWVTNGVTNKALYNENVSSSRTHNAWAKEGAGVTTVALSGNSLPAAVSAVALTIVTPLDSGGTQALSGPLALQTSGGISGTQTTDDGTQVPGVMWATASGVYNFTRDVAGTGAKAVASGATFTVNRHRRTSVKRIINTGTNNPTDARALSDIQALAAQGSDFLIVGPTISQTTLAGTAPYIASRALCATLAAQYGSRFFDYFAYALNTGAGGWWADMSMVPDASNQAEIDAGKMPSLLVTDGLHPSNTATTGFANKIYSILHSTLGWW
jgi:hypothetical protein